ncbi:MAG: BamA/TamA family outer membrane protein [Candidatus Eremiobacteraeota bacterium]|nr:BamA/TamA family outer membrane protein [Candidatus Eremiobacteraeota bacterium]
MMPFRTASRCLAALGAICWLLQPSLASSAPASPSAPIVISVDVSGNAHVPTDRILSVVRTKAGDPFDEKIVQADIAAIFDLGYFTDQVPPLIRQRPDGIAVTFRVVENPVVKDIVITGNDHVAKDTLLALMDTAVGQVFNTSTFRQDVIKINSYYDKIGYGGQLPTHIIALNISNDGVLSLTIREGLTVAHIIIVGPPEGNPILPPNLIKGALTLKEGQPYSDDARDKDYENIKKLYEKYDLQIGDFEAGIDPTSVDNVKGTADVKYDIHVAVVGAVQITGNTKTKDEVIRRQLRLRPGMIITQGLLHRDYDRLNNLGFFEKVELNPKPGPDPKKPYQVTLNWNLKEQRTGTAQIGAGYSGGPNGQGLTGTLSYAENNINGTGNGAQVRFERGSRVSTASLSFSIPYLGSTPKTQKYSLGASIFSQNLTNFYQVYQASAAQAVGGNPIACSTIPPYTCPGTTSTGAAGTIPVVLTPNSNLLSGVAAQYGNRSNGLTLNLGRRLSDIFTASLGVSVQRLRTSVDLPSPFFLAGTQNFFNAPTTNNPLDTSQNGTSTLGIAASSIANTASGRGFNLQSLTLGLQADSRDDIFNPRRGTFANFTQEVSGKYVGSAFAYTITTIDAARFYPVKNATLGLHAIIGMTTGAIPPNKLFVFSDQQLRGYSAVYYGTEERLGQVELRIPVTQDRSFNFALFGDYGSLRIRGATPIVDSFGNVVVDYNKWIYHGDAGVGLRFDVKQLGFRSIRLDLARGKGGSHTSFGIGQSF